MLKAEASQEQLDLSDSAQPTTASRGSATMRYTPTVQDLRLKRLHLSRAWFTPRKCLAAFAASLVAAATVVRLTWTLGRAYSQLHSSLDTDGELVILPEEACRHSGAFCLDGSRPGFYFRPGRGNSKRWLIALPGTGWCWTAEECNRWRRETWLGTTRDIDTTHPFSAILSSDCDTNRVFCEWNIALLTPCDGSSFLGNRTPTLHYKDAAMYMRGSAVLTAILDHLANTMGLASAERVALYGQSSSSLAAVLHIDYARSLLPSRRSSVVAIADGGVTLGNAIGYKRIADVVRLHGIDNAVGSRRCAGSDGDVGVERCLFVDGAVSRTRNRVILIGSLFDPWTFRLLPPAAEPATEKPEQLYTELARRLLLFVQQTPPPPETHRCTVVTTCHNPLLPPASPTVALALAAATGPTSPTTRPPLVVASNGGSDVDSDRVMALGSIAPWLLYPDDAGPRCPTTPAAVEELDLGRALAAAVRRSCIPPPT